MTQETKPLSQIVPDVVAALVCDAAVADRSTGKKNLIGIFDKINVGKFPTQHQMALYIKLTDAEGYYEFKVHYIQLSSGKVLAGAEGELQVDNRLASPDFFIEFPPLPIPEEGRYEFQIWANSVLLGLASIEAVQRR